MITCYDTLGQVREDLMEAANDVADALGLASRGNAKAELDAKPEAALRRINQSRDVPRTELEQERTPIAPIHELEIMTSNPTPDDEFGYPLNPDDPPRFGYKITDRAGIVTDRTRNDAYEARDEAEAAAHRQIEQLNVAARFRRAPRHKCRESCGQQRGYGRRFADAVVIPDGVHVVNGHIVECEHSGAQGVICGAYYHVILFGYLALRS